MTAFQVQEVVNYTVIILLSVAKRLMTKSCSKAYHIFTRPIPDGILIPEWLKRPRPLGYNVQTKVQISIRPYDIPMEIETSERFCVDTFCLKCILDVKKWDWKKCFYGNFRRAQGILQKQLFLKLNFLTQSIIKM